LRVIAKDTAAIRQAARRVDAMLHGRPVGRSTDPVHEYFFNVLTCPQHVLSPSAAKVQLASLDSLCNLR